MVLSHLSFVRPRLISVQTPFGVSPKNAPGYHLADPPTQDPQIIFGFLTSEYRSSAVICISATRQILVDCISLNALTKRMSFFLQDVYFHLLERVAKNSLMDTLLNTLFGTEI